MVDLYACVYGGAQRDRHPQRHALPHRPAPAEGTPRRGGPGQRGAGAGYPRPIVRFRGDDLALLMSIREGKLSFDEIMSIAREILADCERLKATADLPNICDAAEANVLLRTITEHWENRIS